MNRTFAQFAISAAAVVVLGSTASLHAQNTDRGTIPVDFHLGSTVYPAGTYDLKMSVNPAKPMAISTADGAKTSFALTGPAMEQTEKTRARGPVVILKCANKGCFVTEIWTDAQGYQIRHPRALDEQVASSSRVVALTRVISH